MPSFTFTPTGKHSGLITQLLVFFNTFVALIKPQIHQNSRVWTGSTQDTKIFVWYQNILVTPGAVKTSVVFIKQLLAPSDGILR